MHRWRRIATAIVVVTSIVGPGVAPAASATKLFRNGRHLGDQPDAAALGWKGYMDGAPTPCFHGPYLTGLTDLLTPDPYQGDSQAPPAKDYADRHNPFIYFPNLVGNASR